MSDTTMQGMMQQNQRRFGNGFNRLKLLGFIAWLSFFVGGCCTNPLESKQAGWLTPPKKRVAQAKADEKQLVRGQSPVIYNRYTTNQGEPKIDVPIGPFEIPANDIQPGTDWNQYAPNTMGQAKPNDVVPLLPPSEVAKSAQLPPSSLVSTPTAFPGLVPETTPPLTANAAASASNAPTSTEIDDIWNSITPESVASPGGPTRLPAALPWGEPSGTSASAIGKSIEDEAKKEELAREKARLLEIAKKSEQSNLPQYLKPLPPWAGPFSNRHDKDAPDEAEIIRTAHFEPYVNESKEVELLEWEKEEQKGFDWETLDPVHFSRKVRDWVGLGPDEKKATAMMEKGRELILQNQDLKDLKKSEEAAQKFEEAAKRWPDSVLEEDCLYLSAECYFFADRYLKAMRKYEELITKYHHSKYLDTSVRRLFAIGRYWEKQSVGVPFTKINFSDKTLPWNDYFGHAKKSYETIFLNDPNGPISDDAVMALATAYLLRGKEPGDTSFDHAAYYYSYLRENFPNSKHVSDARELELRALTNTYYGAEYNAKSIEKAGKLAEQYVMQHGSELTAEERKEFLALQNEVTGKKAERDLALGKYYDRRRCYGAARMYYQKVYENYPQTVFAEEARSRYETIKDKPAEPREFDWFRDIVRFNSDKKKEGTNRLVDER